MGKRPNKLIYDYIVIGTGPAGAVIAKTLSDDKETSVLILEAGENNDSDRIISDPSFFGELSLEQLLNFETFFTPQYYWQGTGVPQQGLGGRVLEWTTGRLLGGGSSVNTMQYVRPTSAVMSEWESLLGPLWSPVQAIQRFKELEKYNGMTDNPDVHGFSGRLDIRQAPVQPSVMAEKFVSAIESAAGFNEILDYNNPDTPVGPFTRWQLTQQPNGLRESSSTAFFSSDIVTPDGNGVNGRKLKVSTNSTALRILFENKTAVGVQFLKEGKCVQAYARKKVIVSAGVNSTHLLMLSGIGPSESLEEAGIPVIFNNPNVGQNLTNHTLNYAIFTSNPDDIVTPSNDPHNLFVGGALLPDPTPGADPERRAVHLTAVGTEQALIVVVTFLRTKSRGSIKIQNNDPLKIVLADEGFYANPFDMEAVKNIFKLYIKGFAEQIAAIDPKYQLVFPSVSQIDNDEQLEEFIRQNFEHIHHHQSSLRMAPLNQGGVVDSKGQVYGVENLIVADASIIPFTVDGNTSAPAYLIGLTIAQQLLESSKRTNG